ncbi:malate/lactate dehydrogenase [Desulfitobacterium dichloroeliminans LMG P-21439]|uniref:Malate/lactate dehydrogenase n=1 Tax=Desulfitobacterium dichloroeliminans (strain LMG P-21439 / DCA1) TaxID=871963 RepID=L0FD08_DESDL|nr:Ldh family oxidoreductase [Desulfitobacterium dichloroeliminans]AGA70516.1 malate/lactate dehydrogenase [Desulfitobacterium dichloroeliminans LMG P-21439]
MSQVFACQVIDDFCKRLLEASGVPVADAEIVSSIMVDTSLEGVDTHGISRLPVYLKCLLNGRINPKPNIGKNINAAVASVDGDNGLGQLVAYRAMNIAIDLAKMYGIGFVTAKNSNHFGAASTYCKMATEHQMIGQAYTNSPSAIPPWGGRTAYFGTNPISYGFPNSDHPIVIDMSSSIVARGNIILAAKENKPIPEGWAIDKYGNPTTNARDALDGAVLPVGGAKGYALALAGEVMSGIISGSAYGTHVGWIYDERSDSVNIGHSFMAMDISKLLPVEEYTQRLGNMICEIKEIPRADGIHEIRIPGERRQVTAEKRKNEGIPITDGLLQELNALAENLGIPTLNEPLGCQSY